MIIVKDRVTQLQLGVHYRDVSYKYQLLRDYVHSDCSIYGYTFKSPFIEMTNRGELKVSAGYAWDGLSGGIDTRTSMRGSLVHDALYQCLRMKMLPQECRAFADREFLRVCIEDGMRKLRAQWMYYVVRCCGWQAAAPKKGES